MTTLPAHKMLDKLYEFPVRVIQPDEDCDQFLVPWGFTIYRTFYGPGFDEQWFKLLQTITAGTKHRLSEMEGGEDTVVTTKILELLHLDARSDRTLLNGLIPKCWPSCSRSSYRTRSSVHSRLRVIFLQSSSL